MKKKTKKVIAIAISDIHLNLWKVFNEEKRRTLATLTILKNLTEKYPEIPLLISGDLFHGEVGPVLLNLVIDNWPNTAYGIFSISGNHDQEEKNIPDNPTPSMVTFFGKLDLLNCIDFSCAEIAPGIMVWGIPYLTYNKGFVETVERFKGQIKKKNKNILLIHTDLHGALDTDGREVGSVENLPVELEKLFDGFDLVLSGHIHKPQEIIPKVVMVGAPNEQRKSDMESVLGYWEIYDDMSYKFRPYRKAPRFRYYDEDEIPGNDYDFWIKIKKEVLNNLDNEANNEAFIDTNNITGLARAYLKATGVKKAIRKRALLTALKEASNDSL